MKYIIFIFFVFAIVSCCSWSTTICVINKSGYNYLGCYSYSDSFFTCKQKSLEWLRFSHNYCSKGDTLYLKFPTRNYDEIFEKSIDGKVRFFFIKDSNYLNTPWDTIVRYQMYDRKYILGKKELERTGMKIILK